MVFRKDLMVICWILCLLQSSFAGIAGIGNEWDYEGEHGPDHWYLDYPKCAGTHQSPISIKTTEVRHDPNLGYINLHEYDHILNANMSLTNNGHTVQVDLFGQNMSATGGGLRGTYKAEQFHFHWGSVDQRGSEHDFNGVHYPMEMHIVHYLDQYDSLLEAMDKERGLMVLAFLFEVGNAEEHNDHFNDIISHFDEIAHKDDHVSIPSVPLTSLIPTSDNLHHYYRYEGSLTTPPCHESVVWTVFKNTIKITNNQLEAFRHKVMKTGNGQPEKNLSDDFRPAQPINDRIVYTSVPVTDDPYNNAKLHTVNHLCIVIMLISFLSHICSVF